MIACWALLALTQAPEGFVPLAKARTVEVRPAPKAASAGYLGVGLETAADGSLKVSAVEPGSAAAAAGLELGDALAAFAGKPPGTREDFRARALSHHAGETVPLEIVRDGQRRTLSVVMGAVSRPMNPADDVRTVIGVRVPLAPRTEPGVLLEAVTPGLPAAAAGLLAGDLVLTLDGKKLGPERPIAAALTGRRPGEEVALSVRRAGQDLAMKVRLARDDAANRRPGAAPAAGLWKSPTLRLAMIGIEFADVKRHAARTDDVRARSFFAPAPAESLAEFFRRESFGKLRVEGRFLGWATVAKNRADYSQGSGTGNLNALPTEALEKLPAAALEALKDFDALAFVHAGERVRANRGGLYAPHAGRIFFKGKLWPCVFGPDGAATAIGGLALAREFAFMLGLPDLAARTDTAASEGLDQWCLLGAANAAAAPPPLSPWAKERLGWLAPVAVDPTVPQALLLEPSDSGPNHCLKALVRPDGSECFLLENRRARGALPGGLLVWRVTDGLPKLEEAHGIAGPAGPRTLPECVPFPSPQNDAFTPDTTPSSRSPHGGGWPVRVTEIRRLRDGRLALRLGYDFL